MKLDDTMLAIGSAGIGACIAKMPDLATQFPTLSTDQQTTVRNTILLISAALLALFILVHEREKRSLI